MKYLPYISLAAGAWNMVNGLLHTIFVLAQKRKYDRDLLRLLMDGQILITCGLMQALVFKALPQNAWAVWVSLSASVSILVYCALIFPFLKSIGTILVNLILIVALLVIFFQ